MQAITIAIGKSGIQFFTQHYLLGIIQKLLEQVQPPDRNIPIPDFGWFTGPFGQEDCSAISIVLTKGVLKNFAPTYQGLVQGETTDQPPVPIFTLGYLAENFSAHYNWNEIYNWYATSSYMGHRSSSSGSSNNPFDYEPVIGSMTIPLVIRFLFDAKNNAWEMSARPISLPPLGNFQMNLPSNSILLNQSNSCGPGHVNDATAAMFRDIDFETPLNQLLFKVLASIPASGDLGNGMAYDFSLGDSGLAFPNNDGIQMGVKGGASFDGNVFSESNPPALPLPIPPADGDLHHLNMYVSNYEIDALNWAFFRAGKLDLPKIQPDELANPAALKVATYTAFEPSLQPYVPFVMFASITQNLAPTTSFQTVYLFTQAVMNILEKQLPAAVYTLILGLQGDSYVSKSSLEDFLKTAGVSIDNFSVIEDASKISAMVLAQEMDFTLLIQNGQSELPNIKFKVQRTDVLTGLALGIGQNKLQTLQFGFANATNAAAFETSSIPGFDGSAFGSVVWPVTAEALYAENLLALGKAGVPLPIMEDFQFDFAAAQLSIQEGFVAIAASVLYKN